MKFPTIPLLLAALALNLVLSVYLLATRDLQAPSAPPTAQTSMDHPTDVRRLERSLDRTRAELQNLQQIVSGTPAPGDDPEVERSDNNANRDLVSLADRLAAMESSVATLQSNMDGISLEAASAERDRQFAEGNGHLKADQYFEAGKFAIAGEGYLKFLEAHPDHPDHRNILERARNSFRQAGYLEKAIWSQQELMRIYPENRIGDLMNLANLEKVSGNFGEAAQHAAESANLDQSSQRYWSLLYAAWYTELDQGPQAGLQYYRNVEQQIAAAGLSEGKLGARAQEKIEELERRIASGQ